MADWRPICEFGQFARAFETMKEPEVPSFSGNQVVWILAAAPLIGTLVQAGASGLTHKDPGSLWGISVLLNLILSAADAEMLKRRGVDPDKAGLNIAWLVPLYLHRRAEALGHSQAYLLTWLSTFGISLMFSVM